MKTILSLVVLTIIAVAITPLLAQQPKFELADVHISTQSACGFA